MGVSHSEKRIEAGRIQARYAHTLCRVPVFVPTLCRVRQGEKLLQWGERSERAGPQHLALLPAGLVLGFANLPSAQGYVADVVSLSPEVLSGFRGRYGALVSEQIARAPTASLCVPLDPHTAAAWAHLLESFACEAPPSLQNHYAEAVLLGLCLAGHAGPLLIDRRDPLSARVQQVLLLDPACDWTVDDLAARLHLGASTLRRQLAAEGRGFREILEDVRLGVALHRLQMTVRPIGEIAEASGYASPSRFAVRFRQRYGLSPRALRAAIAS